VRGRKTLRCWHDGKYYWKNFKWNRYGGGIPTLNGRIATGTRRNIREVMLQEEDTNYSGGAVGKTQVDGEKSSKVPVLGKPVNGQSMVSARQQKSYIVKRSASDLASSGASREHQKAAYGVETLPGSRRRRRSKARMGGELIQARMGGDVWRRRYILMQSCREHKRYPIYNPSNQRNWYFFTEKNYEFVRQAGHCMRKGDFDNTVCNPTKALGLAAATNKYKTNGQTCSRQMGFSPGGYQWGKSYHPAAHLVSRIDHLNREWFNEIRKVGQDNCVALMPKLRGGLGVFEDELLTELVSDLSEPDDSAQPSHGNATKA